MKNKKGIIIILPKATNVTAASSSGTEYCIIKTSIATTRCSSHIINTLKNTNANDSNVTNIISNDVNILIDLFYSY